MADGILKRDRAEEGSGDSVQGISGVPFIPYPRDYATTDQNIAVIKHFEWEFRVKKKILH